MSKKRPSGPGKVRIGRVDPGLDRYTDMLVKAALAEDIGPGDITTIATVGARKRGLATIIAREPMVIAGHFVAKKVFCSLNKGIRYTALAADGERVGKGWEVARITGNMRAILSAERTALNFLQRLSGVSTLTNAFVRKAGRARILDTRKTTPCMRLLERYAVAAGGGANHRFGLFDAVLIKENHIAAAGGVSAALELIRKNAPAEVTVEVEASTLGEAREAAAAGADIILLDNMGIEKMKKAVSIIGSVALTEASGGITLSNVSAVAAAGVDRISIGALTHSARAADLSLLVEAS